MHHGNCHSYIFDSNSRKCLGADTISDKFRCSTGIATPLDAGRELPFLCTVLISVFNYFSSFHLQLSDDGNSSEANSVFYHHLFSWLCVTTVCSKNIENLQFTIDTFIPCTDARFGVFFFRSPCRLGCLQLS